MILSPFKQIDLLTSSKYPLSTFLTIIQSYPGTKNEIKQLFSKLGKTGPQFYD